MKNCDLLLFVLLFVAPMTIMAGSDHHIHGRGQAKVKITGDKLSIRLALPIQNILGFEREPKSKTQQEALMRAEAMLLRVDNVVKVAVAGECKLASKSLKVKRFKNKRHHQHAEFVLVFKFRCVQPAALDKIEFVLFESFPQLKNLDVVFSSNAKTAHAKELTRKHSTLQITGE